MNGTNSVVVGVDSSLASQAAVSWAAKAAAGRQADLRIVHVCELSRTGLHTTGDVEASIETYLRATGHQLLNDAVGAAGSSYPDVTVSGCFRVGSAAEELAAESKAADMLVVGNLGLGGFVGLLLGSTALELASGAHCAVVTVPSATREAGVGHGVTVGVESRHTRPEILDFAFDEARLLGEPLTAVHAWRPERPLGAGRTMPEVFDLERAEALESAELAAALTVTAAKYPSVELHQRSVSGHAAKVLIDEARGARLLVVGTRGRSELRGLVLGSVSHAVLHHADGPVAVVPETT